MGPSKRAAIVPIKTGTKEAVNVCGLRRRHQTWKPSFSFSAFFMFLFVVCMLFPPGIMISTLSLCKVGYHVN